MAASSPKELRAVVIGATGAVGSEVVRCLLQSDAWAKIITLGRRPVELNDELTQKAGDRLEQLSINMDNMASEAGTAFSAADSVFCALGTTRGAAGSAAAFRRVDLDWVAESARLAAAAGSVKHFALVTCDGANAGLWANDWKVFHGLLYLKVKGQAEEVAKSANFPYLSIFRPGLIERGERARGVEKFTAKALPVSKIKSSDLGAIMVRDAEAVAAGNRDPALAVFSMKDMLAAVKSGSAPVMSQK